MTPTQTLRRQVIEVLREIANGKRVGNRDARSMHCSLGCPFLRYIFGR